MNYSLGKKEIEIKEDYRDYPYMEDREKELKETQLQEESIFEGKILNVKRHTILLPNKKAGIRELIRHIGAVAVIPVTEDGQVIIERQFRYPIGQVITEIPAGKLDSLSEDRLEAAKRELKEETGITADHWIFIGDYHPAAAYTDERISLYIAEGLKFGSQNLDEDEFLHIHKVPLKDLVEEVLQGKITDGKTQAGILKAAFHYGLTL